MPLPQGDLGGWQSVIVAFPGHTILQFVYLYTEQQKKRIFGIVYKLGVKY